jgi:hypothetical protein
MTLHRAVHAAALDVVDALIDVNAGAVELSRVNVNDQRHALDARDREAGGETSSSRGVDDVERFVCARFRRRARRSAALR